YGVLAIGNCPSALTAYAEDGRAVALPSGALATTVNATTPPTAATVVMVRARSGRITVSSTFYLLSIRTSVPSGTFCRWASAVFGTRTQPALMAAPNTSGRGQPWIATVPGPPPN